MNFGKRFECNALIALLLKIEPYENCMRVPYNEDAEINRALKDAALTTQGFT